MTEIEKLESLLTEAGMPFVKNELWGGSQIIYPDKETWVCDAVCHDFSYGHEDGLLELMGLVDDIGEDIEGYLTAEDVFNRIKNFIGE